jgi:hypothetical protein
MKRSLQFLIFVGISFMVSYAQVGLVHQYPTSYNACNGCDYESTGSKFYDDGGENGPVSNKYQLTTFHARKGYQLAFYFTQMDLPFGAMINVYKGSSPKPENLLGTYTGLKKQGNIIGSQLTIEYVPAPNTKNSKGWSANIDEREVTPNLYARTSSMPESDCPYAIPLCANNTAVALGGLYTDLGNINDDRAARWISGSRLPELQIMILYFGILRMVVRMAKEMKYPVTILCIPGTPV